MLPAGVAFHNASLSFEDRKAVEQGFLNGDIKVICSTSTLAVGVNLPCYLVILKGTQGYADTGLQEYSSLEVMQMLGRAGRPQFETEACAVILCLNERVSKYQKMVSGEEVLESSLHSNLVEHLNAEIGLGTVDSMTSAKKWLSSTFLHVRLQKNPQYYNLGGENKHLSLDEMLLRWCERDIDCLTQAALVENNGSLRSTEYGDIMARYCIRFETMKTFMAIPPKAKSSEILNALCQANEFREFKMRQGDKGFYRELNKDNDIWYPIGVDIALPQHKVSLIIQAKLGSVSMGKDAKNKSISGHIRQLSLDTNSVINHAKRLIRCIVDILVQRDDSFAVKSALELARGFAAGVWDNSVMQLKQVPGIGDVFARKLASAGVKDIDTLFNTESHRIEVILSKNPPFGLELIKKVADFPMLHISVTECGQKHQPGKGVDIKLRCEVGFLNEIVPTKFGRKSYNILFLCETSYGGIVDFRRFHPTRLKTVEEILLTSTITQPGAKLRCHIMCDDIVGTHRFAELDIDCPISWFPPALPTPEVSFQRPKLQREAIVRPALEEFDNEGVDDSDLLAAIDTNNTEQIVEDIDDIMTDVGAKKHTRKRSLTMSSGEEAEKFREPQKLANGNWTCQHTCKDEGKECKHKCCIEGVKKKPKHKKQKKDKAATASDAGHRSKSGRKEVKQQPASSGTISKMWLRPDNHSTKESSARKMVAQALRKADPPSNRIKDQKETRRLSDTFGKSSQLPHNYQNAEQISNVLDFDNFGWPAVDEFAAIDWDAVDFESIGSRDGQDKDKTDSEVCGGDETESSLPLQRTTLPRSCDPGSLFFPDTRNPYKQIESQHGSGLTQVLGSTEAHIASRTKGFSAELGRQDPMYSTMHPQERGSSQSSTVNARSPVIFENQIDRPVNKREETDYERAQRLEEEDQKRKYAELGSDLLTYEAFGKYIRIVDHIE